MTDAQEEIGQLCLQVHSARAPGLNVTELKEAADLLARSVPGVLGIGFTEGEDDGAYLNIVFAAREPQRSWPPIREGLLESAAFGLQLKAASIAMCTGTEGWDDYLLLYHYDPSVPVDGASEA
jgi:hypothetical protein